MDYAEQNRPNSQKQTTVLRVVSKASKVNCQPAIQTFVLQHQGGNPGPVSRKTTVILGILDDYPNKDIIACLSSQHCPQLGIFEQHFVKKTFIKISLIFSLFDKRSSHSMTVVTSR